jgi:L-lactate permease
MTFVLYIIAPLLMNMLFSKRKWPWQQIVDPEMSWADRGHLLLNGFIFALMQYIVAAFIGPELPCLLAGLVCMIVYVVMEKYQAIRARTWPAKSDRRYLIPFALLMGVLLIIRLIPGFENVLTGKEWGKTSTAHEVLSPTWKLGGYSNVDFPWLTHSGVIVSIIALVTPKIVEFTDPDPQLNTQISVSQDKSDDQLRKEGKKNLKAALAAFRKPLQKIHEKQEKVDALQNSLRYKHAIKESFKEAWHETYSILISITAFAAMAKLMIAFEMTQSIAQTIVDGLRGAPNVYAMFIPLIGMLGSGLTGSTTTSNFLFSKLQAQTALDLGLLNGRNSVYEVTAAQILGASAGEILSPMNAVVIVLLKGVDKKESDLIKDVFFLYLIWLVLCMFISLIFIVPADGFIN